MLLGQATLSEVQELSKTLTIEQESLISNCMKQEGFDYVAAQPEALALPVVDMSDRATVEEYGFRISTIDFSTLQPSVDNPNEQIVAKLSDAEAQAWSDQHSTCEVSAQEDMSERYDFTSLTTIAEDVQQSVNDDPSALAAQDEWVQCMIDEGLDYPNEETLVASLREEWATIDGNDGASVSEFQALEIRTALISFDCRRALDQEINLARERAMRDMNSPYADSVFPDEK